MQFTSEVAEENILLFTSNKVVEILERKLR